MWISVAISIGNLLVYVPLFGVLLRLAYQTSEHEKLKNLNPEVFSWFLIFGVPQV